MVFPDLSAPMPTQQEQIKPAHVLDRFLTGLFDLLLMVPIATFIPAYHIHEARIDYLQGFDSPLWYQIVFLWILSYVLLQTFFLYFLKATPGGLMTHTRVRSINGNLTWNQCLLRSTFSLLSWVFLGLPFLEIITHPQRRAWHDRVSDTYVADLKRKSPFESLKFNVPITRVIMILGVFMVLMTMFSFVENYDDLVFVSDNGADQSMDSMVAEALLKKDFSDETQNEIEKRVWSSGRTWEKTLSYFFKLNAEKDPDVKKALVQQICQWAPSQQTTSLCALSKYELTPNQQSVQAFAQKWGHADFLTTKVFIMRELTKTAHYGSAIKLYNQLKSQVAVSDSLSDALKIWDVSLFWAVREDQLKSRRAPASAEESKALQQYVLERSKP